MLNWLFFFFVAFGSKLVLALVTIYLIFPADRTCDECDGETLPVRMGPAGRLLSRLLFGTIQRRWCPRCGWEGITRTGRRGRRPPAALPAGTETAWHR
ncbi:MAG TPA: hypothetical protein VFX98_15775 [Longimicrobiaceae bacterium]|nr:hypothetical protein [Longimicrobiaceae bacterium]